MKQNNLTFRGLGLDIHVQVTELPEDHDPSDMPCHYCGAHPVAWKYILDITQLGFTQDNVLTVVECPHCSRRHGWKYSILYENRILVDLKS